MYRRPHQKPNGLELTQKIGEALHTGITCVNLGGLKFRVETYTNKKLTEEKRKLVNK